MPFRTAKYCCYAGVTFFLVAGWMFAYGLLAAFTVVLLMFFQPQFREHRLADMYDTANLALESAKILCVLGGAAVLGAVISAFVGYGAPYSTGAISIDAESDSKTKKQK